MKDLILVRHAKSDWPNVSDIDRPLSERGERDCDVATKYFESVQNLNEYEVHVSLAKRTQQTWQLIAQGLQSLKTVVTEEIYEASLGDLLAYLNKQVADKIILIGHNPSMPRLGAYLTGSEVLKFPTLSIWHIQSDSPWEANLARSIQRLTPRANPESSDVD